MLQNNFKVLLDACTLRRLLVMPWVHCRSTFAIRVSIRQKFYDSELQIFIMFVHNCCTLDRFRRYIVFSKPVLATPLDQPTLQRQFTKWMLRLYLTRELQPKPPVASVSTLNATPNGTPDATPVATSSVKTFKRKRAATARLKPSTDTNQLGDCVKQTNGTPSTPQALPATDQLDDLIKQLGDPPSTPRPSPSPPPELSIDLPDDTSEQTDATPSTSKPSPAPAKDLLDDIFKEMGGTPSTPKLMPRKPTVKPQPASDDVLGGILMGMGGEAKTDNQIEVPSLADAPHKYSIIELDGAAASTQRLLVRASNHGIESSGEPVSCSAKLDFIPAIGAEVRCSSHF